MAGGLWLSAYGRWFVSVGFCLAVYRCRLMSGGLRLSEYVWRFMDVGIFLAVFGWRGNPVLCGNRANSLYAARPRETSRAALGKATGASKETDGMVNFYKTIGPQRQTPNDSPKERYVSSI